jgi:hypothetical protein
MEIITVKQVDMKIEHLATKEDLIRIETKLENKISETRPNS